MSCKIVSAARMMDGSIVARVSPTRYRWANRDGSFSNSRPGDRSCHHLDERVALRLIRAEPGGFIVLTTGERFARRVPALGAAVLHEATQF